MVQYRITVYAALQPAPPIFVGAATSTGVASFLNALIPHDSDKRQDYLAILDESATLYLSTSDTTMGREMMIEPIKE